MTQSGALQTPDWIGNRHFIYAFDRQSGHPIWANRPYPEVRLPLEKALNAYRDDPNSRLPIFPEEPHTLLADGSAGSFATCLKNFGIGTFSEWLDTVQRSEAPVVLDEQAWRDIHIPDDHAGKTPETVCYGRSVSVWPSAALMRMEKRFWNKREDYDTQINIIYPTIVCPTCSSRHPDGVVNCIECSTRLEPRTDQSMITDYMREREDAVRKNRQANPMLLAPSAGINRNRQRVRFEGQEEQRETISAASALRNKCKQMVKRADQRGLGSLADIVDNPIDAYNTSRVGLSVSSLQELATFAHIRLPDISQRAKGGAGKHGAHQTVDARMAYVWPPNERQLDLLTKCLVSFQDRFYKLDEIAILIFAAIKSNRVPGFLILDFAGNVKEFTRSWPSLPISSSTTSRAQHCEMSHDQS